MRSVLEKKGIPKKKRGIPKKEKTALRVIRLQGQMARRMPQDFFMKSVQKNDPSSKSVNSFDTGPIFLPSLGQELSRNVFVVSVYAF